MAASWGHRQNGSRSHESRVVRVGGATVRPCSKSLIKPATPTENHWLSLSNLDRLVNPTFTSVILFYKDSVKENHQIFQDVIKSLKESLSKVLVHFYPLAGRLAVMDDGLVNLHCNDSGAVFLEASVDADLNSLGGAKPMPTLSGLDFARMGRRRRHIPDQLESMPTLVVMVTKFKCGSIAVAVNWHHTVADGTSGCHFIKSWAEICSGKSLSLTPVHDRSLLRASDRASLSLVRGCSYSTESSDTASHEWGEELRQDQLPTCTEPPVLNSFHINKEFLERIQAEVMKSSSELSHLRDEEEGIQFTAVECISAYIWWQMMKARRAADHDESCQGEGNGATSTLGNAVSNDSFTQFFLFVDGRKRMNLPEGYFGNVLCSACATAGLDEILSRPLSYAASLIRGATMKITEEYIRSVIDWVEIQPGGFGGSSGYKPEHMNSLGRDVAATFWTSFPLYEMDFGWGGKPELAARNSPPRAMIDGIAILPSREGPENMVALLNLHADRMKRLTMQDSFKALLAGQA